ncbi:MAG: preprotein translocase subunit SecE [Deltaproteobacteria bacterium]|nr:preprotein translocase subunit SecE [Deltaproteobacteria bacterium]
MDIVDKVKRFLLEVRSEMKKVVWPEKRNLFSATIAVVIFIIVVTVILSVLDYIFSVLGGLIFK